MRVCVRGAGWCVYRAYTRCLGIEGALPRKNHPKPALNHNQRYPTLTSQPDVRKMPLLDGAVPFGVSDATNHDQRTVGGRRPLESAAARR